eukprot:TRINITY_DN41383_c0_g1_i1.p1 TRINITY_DN41383_c0_g1~~TRINITY_DN41383_c0_g1_i1.p1  ORF type:complete len:299 (+),score=114.58 TRINITY_DN41383_c0_g1_i1:2-898(+)
MKLLFLLALIAFAFANDEIIKAVNQDNLGWTAGKNQYFEGMTTEEIKASLGTFKIDNLEKFLGDKAVKTETVEGLPKSFDPRSDACIHPVRNQAHCGSCWAFATSEVMSDRFCLASKGKVDVILSPQALVSCDKGVNQGCNGGIPHLAFDYVELRGLPTEGCFPYVSGDGHEPSCSHSCAAHNETLHYYRAKAFSVHTFNNEKALMTALMNDGPVVGAFTVYEDFISYKNGIYTHTYGSQLGGHAVEMVGWSEENGSPYWIVKNSWTKTWGEEGYFRIARGTSGTGIDTGACAATPHL